MNEEGPRVTRPVFEQNLAEKREDPVFTADLTPLLTPGFVWSFDTAYDEVCGELVARLPGERWKRG